MLYVIYIYMYFILYIRSYLRIQKSQVMKDGGLVKSMEKLVFFQPILLQKQKVLIKSHR